MPFRSKSQVRACFAKKDPNWDCHQWADETSDIKSLPEKKKKKFSEWLNEESNRNYGRSFALDNLIKEISDYVGDIVIQGRVNRTRKNSQELMGKSEVARNIQIRIDSSMAAINAYHPKD